MKIYFLGCGLLIKPYRIAQFNLQVHWLQVCTFLHLSPLSKKSTRDCVAAIIQSTRDTVDTASQTTFNPTKLTKNQNVNEIDHEKDHEFRRKNQGDQKEGML